MDRQDILIFDIETDSLNVEEAKLKWFGAYSYLDKEYYLLPYTEKEQIKTLISRHGVFVGFNQKDFDIPILENEEYNFDYKVQVDLLKISRKNLPSIKPGVPDFKLKTISEHLNLDEFGKGDIDYKIFQKNEWLKQEIVEIKKYLKQDLILTKKLFEWYEETFEPLKKYISVEDIKKFNYIRWSLASLSYHVICNLSGIKPDFNDKSNKPQRESFEGGHHIEPRKKLIVGDIVSIDFVSAYPHAIMQHNLISESKEFGKVEQALQKIFLERLKAKQEGDKIKSQAYKIVINALYGLLGNYAFKNLYNPSAAGKCTLIVRTWLKQLAKTMEENGFYVIYGFTDNVILSIPNKSSIKRVQIVAEKFIEDIKKQSPFPQETFKLEIDKKMKLFWIVEKNCYLWVTENNKVEYKSTLLNRNTPEIVMKVFNDYMSPKIINDLNISFSKEELEEQIKSTLISNPILAAEEFNVDNVKNYKVKTSCQYLISEKYGEGRHFLIPNLKGIGVGKAKSTKKKIGVRYCSLEEFKQNNLSFEDIDISQLIKHLKPFLQEQTQ